MDRVLHRDERGIFDAAVGALYLDTKNATDTTTPLQVTVQNRGTEYLPNVSILLSQNGGYPQKIYLRAVVRARNNILRSLSRQFPTGS